MKKIFKHLIIILTAVIFTACGGETPVGKVGDVRFSHTTYQDEVYIILRENGQEAYVVGRDNVDWSISVYKENGTFGKEVQITKIIK